jgi:hypothetical protein
VSGRLAAALLALAAAGCVSDTYGDPLPGHEVRVVLRGGEEPAAAPWPVGYRRGAEYALENATGRDIETLILDLSTGAAPRELDEVTVVDPPGAAVRMLPAPVGEFPLRARLGNPGSVLLPAGATLRLRLHVKGIPGAARLVVVIPGVTVQ